MRHAYLRKTDLDESSGCRGGVTTEDDPAEYELEIGNSCNASCRMLALCSLVDEVEEFLKMTDSLLAKMILSRWSEEKNRLEGAISHRPAG